MRTTIMVIVKRKDEAPVYDLEVPVDLPANQLAARLAGVLRCDKDPEGRLIAYELEAHPPGRCLGDSETLAEAGISEGSWLVLVEAGSSRDPENPAPINELPIEPKPTGIYTWKRIDE